MNLGNIMKPLSEKMGALTELVQDMETNLSEQTVLQSKILTQLTMLNDKFEKLLNEKKIE